MNNKNNMENITVEEFLEKTKSKKYKQTCTDMSGISTMIEGKDISKSFRMDTIERISSYDDGSFILDYGVGIPKYLFKEIMA